MEYKEELKRQFSKSGLLDNLKVKYMYYNRIGIDEI